MKTSQIKNKLKKETDALLVPDVLSEVVENSKIESKPEKAKVPNRSYKKAVIAFATCVVLVFSVIGIVFLVNGQDDIGGGVIENQTYMTLDINPSVSFIADSNRKITSVFCNNADAETVIAKMDGQLVGKNLEEGIESFVDMATRLGYIKFEASADQPDVVRLSSITQGKAGEIEKAVEQRLTGYFGKKGLYTLVYFTSISKDEYVKIAQEVDTTANLEMDFLSLTSLLTKRKTILEKKYADFNQNYSSSEALKAVYLHTLIEEKFNNFFKCAQAMKDLDKANQNVVDKSGLYLHDGFYYLDRTTTEAELTLAMAEFRQAYRNCLCVLGLEDKTLSLAYVKTNLALYSNISDETLADCRDKADVMLQKLKTKAEDFDAILGKIQTEFGAILSFLTDLQDKLDNIPTSLGDFISNHLKDVQTKAEQRANVYLKPYNEARESLKDVDFDKIRADIIQDYGSMENYYDIIKEKNI